MRAVVTDIFRKTQAITGTEASASAGVWLAPILDEDEACHRALLVGALVTTRGIEVKRAKTPTEKN